MLFFDTAPIWNLCRDAVFPKKGLLKSSAHFWSHISASRMTPDFPFEAKDVVRQTRAASAAMNVLCCGLAGNPLGELGVGFGQVVEMMGEGTKSGCLRT